MTNDKIHILIEALPYIKKFQGKTFVIKYGGSIMESEEVRDAFIEDIVLLTLVGIKIVIVHGGGPSINDALERLGVKTEFKEGLRVTDELTMEVVEMVLTGKINKKIVSELCRHGIKGIGISGRDDNLIIATKKTILKGDEILDIGYVGDVKKINNGVLNILIENNYVPVISPVGCDDDGNSFNINADFVASAISHSLKAEKLLLITDIEGLYKDINDKSTFISSINLEEIKKLIEDGTICGGMIPKMKCCIEALENGTKNIHLIDGRTKHSLLLEIFTKEGLGTMIEGDN
ncbi:MAG: acetylglutamate kinase [Proteocatella sp.]